MFKNLNIGSTQIESVTNFWKLFGKTWLCTRSKPENLVKTFRSEKLFLGNSSSGVEKSDTVCNWPHTPTNTTFHIKWNEIFSSHMGQFLLLHTQFHIQWNEIFFFSYIGTIPTPTQTVSYSKKRKSSWEIFIFFSNIVFHIQRNQKRGFLKVQVDKVCLVTIIPDICRFWDTTAL